MSKWTLLTLTIATVAVVAAGLFLLRGDGEPAAIPYDGAAVAEAGQAPPAHDPEPGAPAEPPSLPVAVAETPDPPRLALPDPPAADTFRLTGRVLLPDGAPAHGASLLATASTFQVMPSPGSEHELAEGFADSGEDGAFELPLPGAADKLIFLQAHLEGYGGVSRFIIGPEMDVGATPEQQQTRGLELRLRSEAAIYGTLLYENGDPAPGYEMHSTQMLQEDNAISFLQSAGGGVETDAGGKFELRGLVEASVTIGAVRDGEFIHTWTANAPNEALVLTIPEAGQTIAGRVYRQDTGFALSGADIILMREASPDGGAFMFMGRPVADESSMRMQTRSDSAGRYSFEDLRPGNYAVYARHAGERLGLLRVEADGQDVPLGMMGQPTVSLEEDASRLDADIHMYAGDRFHGHVREDVTNEPIEGVAIQISTHGSPGDTDVFGDRTPHYASTTDDEGRFSIPRVLHPGQVRLSARKPGHVASVVGLSQGHAQRMHGGTMSGEFMLYLRGHREQTEREVTINMSRDLTISGVVRHEDGTPVADATVAFIGRSRTEGSFPTGPSNVQWHPVDHRGAFVIPAEGNSEGVVLARTAEISNLQSEHLTIDDRPLEGVELLVKSPGRVSGRVVDGEGRALPRAQVALTPRLQTGTSMFTHGEAANADSDADGRFRFENLAEGHYGVSASMEGRVPSGQEWFSLGAGAEKTGVELTLESGGEIHVRVVDPEGRPIEAANIHIYTGTGGLPLNWGSGGTQARTGADGRYSYSPVGEGLLQVQVSKQGYEHMSARDLLPGPDEHELVLQPQTERVLIVDVLDAGTGGPVSGFSVRALNDHPGAPVRSEQPIVEDGRFIDRSLTRYTSVLYIITHDDYADGQVRRYVAEDDYQMEETVRLYKGSEVTGRVVDRESGEPIAHAAVEYYTGTHSPYEMRRPLATGRTGEDGRFRFERVTGGRGTIEVRPPSPHASRREQVSPDGTNPLDVGDIEIGGGGAIRVTVIRGESPVPGQIVSLSAFIAGSMLERSGTTGADGSYTFESLPYASYTLHASGTMVQASELRDGDLREVSIVLGSASLELDVRYRGEPASVLGSYSLQLQGTARGSRPNYNPQSIARGVYTYRDLPAGSYTVHVNRQTTAHFLSVQDVASYTLSEGEERREVLNLPGGEIHGRIVDAGGDPVRGASLVHRALDEDNRQSHIYRDASAAGEIAANLLSPGRHWFRAEHPELGNAETIVELGRDELIEDLRLVLGEEPTGTLVSIALRITDGQPVENAWCRVRAEDGRDYTPSGTQRRDADGALTIENLPAGEYSVVVSAWGHSEGHHTVTIEAGQTTYIDDILYEAGSMRWTLVSEDGAPIAGAETRLVPLDPDSIETVRTGHTDDAGQWNQRGLYPGQYRAEATLPDGLTLTQPFTITAHEHTEETTTR